MKKRQYGIFHQSQIVPYSFAKCLITVDFVFAHQLICFSSTDIGALNLSHSLIENWPCRNICTGDFSRNDGFAIDFANSEERADRRFHLFALLYNLVLQILNVVDAHRFKVLAFVQAKNNDTAAVLIGKTGQRVKKSCRATAVCRFCFYALKFAIEMTNSVN